MAVNKYIVTLIELKKHGLTNENADERLLSTALVRAQEIDLVEATCKTFVEDFKAKNGAYDAAEQKLIDNYVIPYLAICLDIRASDALSNRIDNAGLGRVSSTNQERASDENRRLFINSLRHDKTILFSRLNKAVESYCGGGCGGGSKHIYPRIMTM